MSTPSALGEYAQFLPKGNNSSTAPAQPTSNNAGDYAQFLPKNTTSPNINSPSVASTFQTSGNPQFDTLIHKHATANGIDPNVLRALIQQESSFNPNATSSVGAMGLTQLMPDTARGLGVNNAFDPDQNIGGGAKYLAQQMKAFGGSLPLALAAYNAGPGAVRKYKGIPPYAETQAYVKKIMASLPAPYNTQDNNAQPIVRSDNAQAAPTQNSQPQQTPTLSPVALKAKAQIPGLENNIRALQASIQNHPASIFQMAMDSRPDQLIKMRQQLSVLYSAANPNDKANYDLSQGAVSPNAQDDTQRVVQNAIIKPPPYVQPTVENKPFTANNPPLPSDQMQRILADDNAGERQPHDTYTPISEIAADIAPHINPATLLPGQAGDMATASSRAIGRFAGGFVDPQAISQFGAQILGHPGETLQNIVNGYKPSTFTDPNTTLEQKIGSAIQDVFLPYALIHGGARMLRDVKAMPELADHLGVPQEALDTAATKVATQIPEPHPAGVPDETIIQHAASQEPSNPVIVEAAKTLGVKPEEVIAAAKAHSIESGDQQGSIAVSPTQRTPEASDVSTKPSDQAKSSIQPEPTTANKPSLSPEDKQKLNALPGVRNLPDEIKVEAMQRAQAQGITKDAAQTVDSYRARLENLGLSSAEAAAKANAGKLNPSETFYLGHIYDSVAKASRDAYSEVDHLRGVGASPEVIKAAEAKADTLDQQATDILKGFTQGTSETARALRMQQELDKGTLDLSRLVRQVETTNRRPLSDAGNKAIRKAYDKYQETKINQESTTVPPESASFGAKNTIFTEDKLAEAKKALRERLGQINSGFDPVILKHWATVGGYYIEGGLREFGAWAAEMRKDGANIYSDRQLRDIYAKSYQMLKDQQLRGSKFGSDIYTEGRAGLQSPEVLKARQELMQTIRKNIRANPFDIVKRGLQAPALSHPSIVGHIAMGGPGTLAFEELSRIPQSLRNFVAQAKGQSIYRQGFSISDFTKSMVNGIKQGTIEAPRYIMEGQNSVQKQFAAATDEFFGGSGLKQTLDDLKTGFAEKNGNLIQHGIAGLLHTPGLLHGATQQFSSWFTSYYRALADSAHVMSRNLPESTLQGLDPSLQHLEGSTLRNAAKQFLVKNPTDEMALPAMEYAVRNSMLNQNVMTKGIESGRSSFRSHGTGGKSLDAVISAFMPIVRPGTNVGFRILEGSPVGLTKGLIEDATAKFRGEVKTLEPADRAEISKLIDRGLVGTAFITLGYLLHKKGSTQATYSPSDSTAKALYAQQKARKTAESTGVANTLGFEKSGDLGTLSVGGSGVPLSYLGVPGLLMQMGTNLDRGSQQANPSITAQGAAGLKETAMEALPISPVVSAYDKYKKDIDSLSKVARGRKP